MLRVIMRKVELNATATHSGIPGEGEARAATAFLAARSRGGAGPGPRRTGYAPGGLRIHGAMHPTVSLWPATGSPLPSGQGSDPSAAPGFMKSVVVSACMAECRPSVAPDPRSCSARLSLMRGNQITAIPLEKEKHLGS